MFHLILCISVLDDRIAANMQCKRLPSCSKWHIRYTLATSVCHKCQLHSCISSLVLRISHDVRWNICYCTALYSKYKRTYTRMQLALVTHLSGKCAYYMPCSSRTLSHDGRWNICYCTALYSKYQRTDAPMLPALVTD